MSTQWLKSWAEWRRSSQQCDAEKMPKKEIWSIYFRAGMRERESWDERRGGWREIQREEREENMWRELYFTDSEKKRLFQKKTTLNSIRRLLQ